MKKRKILLLAGMLLSMLFSVCRVSAAEAEEPAEWTVLFYLCGSDLESRYGYATENLKEISRVRYPDSFLSLFLDRNGIATEKMKEPGRVNVLVETGGSSEWHTGDTELNMDIDTGALQRWQYRYYSFLRERMVPNDGFKLMETLPLKSMADPETLTEFIRWGTEAFPAKKYALVLWDHGDGARTGLFIDELFDRDIMYLYELKQALKDGGTFFETLIIDACLMANIETAWNVKDSAAWMVASEEVVPGKGTAVGEWLQQLLYYPECGGEWLGRCVCDTTCIKYANEAGDAARSTLTWSVIDLSKMDSLIESAGALAEEICTALRDYPEVVLDYMRMLLDLPAYGDGQQNMRDIGSAIYHDVMTVYVRWPVRNNLIQSLSEAVDYLVHGSGRNDARGLTFCYPSGFSSEELDIYAKNFPMPPYLAFIDAASEWTAPEWVYDSVDRLPKIDEIPELQLELQRQVCGDGMPGIMFHIPASNLDSVYYRLYRLDDKTGAIVRLGRTDCIIESSGNENFDLIWRAADPMHWPSVEGEFLCMDLLQTDSVRKLYNVPILINNENSVLRLGRESNYAENEEDRINDYEMYGLWVGYEENSLLLDRSVERLSSLAGQEFRLLYPVDVSRKTGKTLYEASQPLTMYRALDVEEMPLPAGTYYLEYEIHDVFKRSTVLDRIEIRWDGETMTFPDITSWKSDVWENLSEMNRE